MQKTFLRLLGFNILKISTKKVVRIWESSSIITKKLLKSYTITNENGLDEKDDIITWTGPLLAGRMLIVSGSHGIVAAISPYSGKFLGAINVKSSINTQAIVADETVYFITSDGYLLAYR